MSVPLSNLTDTWNNGSTVFNSILMNVTNTASDPASKLLDLQVGSSSKFSVDSNGSIRTINGTTEYFGGIDLGGAFNIFDTRNIGLLALQGGLTSDGTIIAINNSYTVTGTATAIYSSMNATGEVVFRCQNNGTGGSVFDALQVGTASSGLGPMFRAGINGGATWCLGTDPNASGNFKLCSGPNFASSAIISVTPAGAVALDTYGSSLHINGVLGVGGSPDPNTLINASGNVYDPTAQSVAVNIGKGLVLNANNSNQVLGISCYVSHTSGAYVQSGALYGAVYTVYASGAAGSTVYNATGTNCFIYNTVAAHLLVGHSYDAQVSNLVAGGTIDTYVGYYCGNNNNAGTMTNFYGVYIDDGPGGTITNQWGIYVKSLPSYFGSGIIDISKIAVGSHADLTNVTQSPGDATNAYTFAYPFTLGLNNFFSGDFGSLSSASLSLYAGYKHTGTTASYAINSIDAQPSVNSDSTGPINYFQAISAAPYNYGSGHITNLVGINLSPWAGGTGTIDVMAGVLVSNGYSQTVTNGYGVRILKPSGTHGVNSIGLDIEDHTGSGTTISYNIWSKGATSVNKFEGTNRMGIATNSTPSDGDFWYDGTNVKFRVGGTTKTFTLT
jgi:hypothetical protein